MSKFQFTQGLPRSGPDLAGGYPIMGVTHHGVPPGKGPGTSHWGTPQKGHGTVEVLWDGDGVPPR